MRRLFPVLLVACGTPRPVTPDPAGGPILDHSRCGGTSAITIDDQTVYWVTVEGIRAVPRDGSAPSLLIDAAEVDDLVVQDDRVYFTSDEAILVVPRTGGEPSVLVEAYPVLLAADDAALYWVGFTEARAARMADLGAFEAPVVLERITHDGRDRTAIAELDFEVRELAVVAGQLFLTGRNGGLYVVDARGGRLELLDEITLREAVAVDPDGVFWTTEFARTIEGVAHGGGEPTTLAAEPEAEPTELALGDRHVFFVSVDGDEHAVRSVPKAGGPVSTISEKDHTIMTLAAEGEDAFWVELDDGVEAERRMEEDLPGRRCVLVLSRP